MPKPYFSPTAPTQSQFKPLAAVSSTPKSTHTPQVYTIARNDTFYGIARKFDVTPEVLIMANPSSMPSSLTIGDTLIIPGAIGSDQNIPVYTPVPLDLGASTCVAQPDGLECFTSVFNGANTAAENISVRFTLFDVNGKQIEAKDGLLLLNILPAGTTLPASVFFPGILEVGTHTAVLISSNQGSITPLPPVVAQIVDPKIETSWNGLTSTITGNIEITSNTSTEKIFWVAAVGYDAQGHINSYRRWEGKSTSANGVVLPFNLELYSLTGMIERIELILEEIQ